MQVSYINSLQGGVANPRLWLPSTSGFTLAYHLANPRPDFLCPSLKRPVFQGFVIVLFIVKVFGKLLLFFFPKALQVESANGLGQ